MDCPSPVPAASSALVPPGSGVPTFKTQNSSGARYSMLCPQAPRSFSSVTCFTPSSSDSTAASTVHGKFVARTRLLITGPAIPNPAASILSEFKCAAAARANSFAMKSNFAKSLLGNRCLKTSVSFPLFSANRARLHFVPPTSPARITSSPCTSSLAVARFSSCFASRIEPSSSVALQQHVRFSRPPASRPVQGHRCAFRRAPRGRTESFLVAEVHRHVPDAHVRPGTLRAKGNGNTFIRLDVQNQPVRFRLSPAKHDVRRPLELNDHFRAALRQPLSGSQIERHSRPSPVVDQQPHRHERLRSRSRCHSRLFPVPRHRLSVELPPRVLPAHHGLRHHLQIERADRLQHLQLLVAHRGRIERGRRFHRHQGRQLQHVALNHVAQRARRLIKSAAPLYSQRLSRRNLNVVHVIPVP